MRFTGPVRFSHHGDEEVARQYNIIARNLIGVMAAASQQPFSTRSVRLSNGVRITVEIIAQPVGSDRDWAEDAVSMMWSGQYQVSAHIYAPPGTKELPLADEDTLQYQYAAVATGEKGYEVVTYEGDLEGTALVSGAWVVVLFVATTEGTVLTAAFPVTSTLTYVKPDAEENELWPWYDAVELGAADTYQKVLSDLYIKRYEVVQATANHVLTSDKLIHAPWMPKGVAPYNSYGFCFGGMREAGLADQYSYTLNGSGQQATVSNSATAQLAFDSFSASDAGYEDSLKIYRPKPGQGLDEPVKTSADGGVPDADWYETYSTFEAETILGQTREFGVLIDASQKLHVWMTEAEGTENTTGSPYLDQAIKTSVANEYVRSVQLELPSDVYVYDNELRDIFPDFDTIDFESSRYAWVVDSTGKKFAAIGVERVYPPIGHVVDYDEPAPISLFYSPNDLDATSATSPAYWLPRPVLLTLELEVQVYGEGLSDFLIMSAAVKKEPTQENFYPLEVAFSRNNVFDSVGADELLVAGFEGCTLRDRTARTKEEFVSGLALLQYMFFVGQASNAPVPYLTNPGLRVYTTHYLAPERRGFDFSVYGDGAVGDAFANLVREYTYETEFVVYAGASEVFRKTVRAVSELDDRVEFFTAQVVASDLKSGSFAFGTTVSSSVLSDTQGVDSVDRSHVVYYKGQAIDAGDETHLARLDKPLESVPLDPEHTNFAMVGTVLTSVPTPFYSTNYFSEIYFGYDPPPNTLRIHFDDYPWGLEMYAHMACNLFVPARASHQIVADGKFFSFVWGYHKQTTDTVWDINTNELVEPVTFEYVPVDLLRYKGSRFSHQQFFDEAFRESDEKTISASAEGSNVGAYATGTVDGEAVGYAVYRNYALLAGGDWVVSLEAPAYRQYCAGVTFPGAPNSVHFSNNSDDWAVIGKVLPGFANRVYGYLEAADGD